MTTGPSSGVSDAGVFIPTAQYNLSINIDGPTDEDARDVIESETREMPFDGVISRAFVEFPNGVHSRVGFRLEDDERGRPLMPYDEESDWVSFNDVQDWFSIGHPMRAGEEIKVTYINSDHHVEGHKIGLWLEIIGADALPYDLEDLAERDGVRL